MKVFIEKQRFNQWWLYLILIVPIFTLVLPLILKTDKILASNHLSDILIPLLILLLVYFFFFSIHLKTRIDEKGIHYQFFPFNLKLKLIPWNELEQSYCRNYNPLTEYGGWGYRINFRNSKALNIRGNQGIQLIFKNGNKLLIGTQKPEEVKRILETYNTKMSPTKLVNSF